MADESLTGVLVPAPENGPETAESSARKQRALDTLEFEALYGVPRQGSRKDRQSDVPRTHKLLRRA